MGVLDRGRDKWSEEVAFRLEVLKEWNGNTMMISVWSRGDRDTCVFECKCYDLVRRRWMRTWDGLDEKERTMDVIKGYVEVNDIVENKPMRCLSMKGIV